MSEKKHNTTPHVRDEALAIEVKALCECGIIQDRIAKHIGVSKNTLRKYYKKELDTALTMKIQEVAGKLFQAAMDGDTTAMIFFLKTQGGWSTTVNVTNDEEQGGFDFSKLNDEQLENVIGLLEESRVDDVEETA